MSSSIINEFMPLFEQQTNKTSSRWRNRIVNFFKNIEYRELARRYSDVVSQVTLLGLNTLFLVGVVDHKLPPSIASGSYVALSFLGLIPLNFQIDWIRKLIQDSLIARRVKNWVIMISSATKATYMINGILLTFASCAASITRFTHHKNTTNKIYQTTRPWSETILVLGFILNVVYIFIDRYTLKKIKKGLSDHEVCDIVMTLKDRLNVPVGSESEAKKLAAYIRGGMDKDTLRTLLKNLEKLNEDDHEKMHAIIETTGKNIDIQLKVRIGGNLVLKVLGDILIGIEDMYPGTVVEGSINLGVSLIYTLKLFIEKLFEIKQREKIGKTSDQISLEKIINQV